jgi:hypothetical protein
VSDAEHDSEKTLTKTRPKKANIAAGPPVSDEPIPEALGFAIGDLASHPQFGDGTVTAIEKDKLTIEFEDGRVKQIVDYYVKRNHRPQSATLEILIKSYTKHICHSPHHRRWTAQCAIVQLKSMRDRRRIRYFDVGAGGRRMLHCAGDATRPTCEPKSTRTRVVMKH